MPIDANGGDPDNQLQDGFQELFTFDEHRLNLRGFGLVEWTEESKRQTDFNMQQTYISWDVKQVLLWKFDFRPNHSPKLLHHVKFSNQPNFICAIVNVPRMKVFLAAALDMTFKIFDRNLRLLESIHHEERAILQLELDAEKDIIYSSGANGISVWRLYRNTSVDKAHIMEKLYSFEDCEKWVTHMIYEPRFNRVYAIKERSVQVLSTTRRSVITVLADVHDAPVNVVCWYERNQFYMTGCSRGEIKCWTSNFNQKTSKSSSSSNLGKSNDAPSKMFSLLHTFKGHTKAVTGLRLHPVSGLAISTSLDGFLKVLNLEALNELFSIHMGVGISGMRIINIGMHHHGVLMSTTDATIKLWKITSVCDFFGVTSSKVARLEVFENLEAELELHHRQKRRDFIMQTGGLDLASMNLRKPPTSSAAETNPHDDDDHEHGDDDGSGDDDGGDGGGDGGGGDDGDGGDDNTSDDNNRKGGRNRMTPSSSSRKHRQSKVTYADGGSIHDKILVTYSTQDLRAFTQSGQLLGRLEPEHVVEGIKDYCVSVYLKLLFCLCDGDRVLVFDLRRFTFPLVQEFHLRGPGGSSNNSGASALAAAMAKYNHAVNGTAGDGYPPSMPPPQQQQQQQQQQQPRTASTVEDPDGPAGTQPKSSGQGGGTAPHLNIVEDLGVCCELVDVGPAVGLRAPRFTSAPSSTDGGGGGGSAYKTDPRGQRVPEYIESYVLIGMKNGAILFLDALNHFEVQMNFQATNGIVMDLKYRRRQRELIVLGQDLSHTFASIRIWRLPDMDFLGEVTNMRHVSCLGISSSLNFFAVGMHDGNVRLFNHDPEAAEVREIVKSGESHTLSVSALCFCDDLRLYFTTSVDGRIKIWDYEKRLIRSIALNLSSCAVVPGPLPGDVIISQNFYLLTVPKRIWNEDDVLETMRAEFEANANEDIPENIIDEIIQQKSQALAKLQHQQSTHHNGGGGGGDDPATTHGAPPPRIRRESQLDGDDAPSDDEQQPSPPPAAAATAAAGGGMHRPSISDRRSSRHPSKPQVDDPATAQDAASTTTTGRNPPPPLLRHGGTAVGGDTLAARKASSSILVTSRRKASMSMARNSMYHNGGGGAAMLPNGPGGGLGPGGADGVAAAASGSNNDPGHRSSFAAAAGGGGGGRKDSHDAAVNGGGPVNNPQQVLESFERELLLPVLQKQQFRFVSGGGGAGPSVSASSSIATTDAWPPQQQQQQQLLQSSSLVGSDYHAPHQPSAVRFQETQYAQPKPPPSSSSSSSSAMRSDVLDVLHPRFVVHDKPPARMVKLEDVDRHLRHLQQRVLQQQQQQQPQPQQQQQQQAPPPSNEPAHGSEDRPHASFGLSPRARLTLMHSSPAQQALHQAAANPSLTDFSSASKRSAFDAAHQQHQQLQAQETMILNMALGMKVSSQYKQHRQSINAVRQQRLSVMNRRVSVMTAGTSAAAAAATAAAGHATVGAMGRPLDGMSEASDEMDDASDSSGGRGRSSSIDRVNREELMATKTLSSSTIGSVDASPPVFLGATATASGSQASFHRSSQQLKDDGSVDTSVSNAGTVDMRAPERTALLRAQGSVKLRRSVVTFSSDAR